MIESTRRDLAHDITNKMFAIISHCDDLELRLPSPWVTERTAQIKDIAAQVSELLRLAQASR